jgi:hypothetical protein
LNPKTDGVMNRTMFGSPRMMCNTARGV